MPEENPNDEKIKNEVKKIMQDELIFLLK